jgi:putative peptidoglycan lipid II flippase
LIRQRFISLAARAMSVATVGLAVAFVRQLLIAAYFGASRELEIYLFAYAVANWVGFALGVALDSVTVIHLVHGRENAGADGSRALARAAFQASAAMGLTAAMLMVAATYLLAPVIATGFTTEERALLGQLSWYFLPWVCVLLPYYAAAARHKSEWRFNRVFLAEIIASVISISWLVADHSSIRQLPIAYCAGYAAALVWLLPRSQLIGRAGRSKLGPLLRDVGELYLANQTGNLPSIADRHFQSLVNPGGIAAIGYSSQLLMGISSLIGMREIFIVPLSEVERRNERIEQLIAGMLLLSVPIAGAVACFAPELVQILFQRGRFDAAAAELTASVLRILAFTLVIGAIATPLARVLQIVRQIRLMHVNYLASFLLLLASGGILIVWFRLGAQGIAWMHLAASVPSCAILVYLVSRCGIALRWRRLAGFLLFALLVTAAAAAAALAAASAFTGAWLRVSVGGVAYAAVLAMSYFAARRRLSGLESMMRIDG